MIFSNFPLWKQNIENVNQVNAIAAVNRLNLKNDMDSISKYIKEERDVLYLKGQAREQMKFVKNLLTKLQELRWTMKQLEVTQNWNKSLLIDNSNSPTFAISYH